MNTIIAAAFIAAGTCAWLVHPLMSEKDKKVRQLAYAIMAAVALGSLSLYSALGSPALP